MKGQRWEDYERAADRGPGHIAVKVIVLLFALGALIGGIGYVFGWFGEAAKVAQDEFGPKAALEKYTLLKDMHAQLDKKLADIKVAKARLAATEEAYKGVPRAQWPRDERESYQQQQAELEGIKMSYNDLAAQYNAKMAEVHYRFANAGELPQGATEPLPREYAPYVDQ